MPPKKKQEPKTEVAKRALTRKQQTFFDLIRLEIRARGGVSPTLTELAVSAGVSKSTAAVFVRRLREKGWITYSKGKHRAIRPL